MIKCMTQRYIRDIFSIDTRYQISFFDEIKGRIEIDVCNIKADCRLALGGLTLPKKERKKKKEK